MNYRKKVAQLEMPLILCLFRVTFWKVTISYELLVQYTTHLFLWMFSPNHVIMDMHKTHPVHN